MRDPRSDVFDQFTIIDDVSGGEDDERLEALAPAFTDDSDDRDVRPGGTAEQRLLHLDRRDVLAVPGYAAAGGQAGSGSRVAKYGVR